MEHLFSSQTLFKNDLACLMRQQSEAGNDSDSIFLDDTEVVEEFILFLRHRDQIALLNDLELEREEIIKNMWLFSLATLNQSTAQFLESVLLDEGEIEIFFLDIAEHLNAVQY